MGSDYQPNVVAAEHVIEFARELPDVEFVIMGTVGNSLTSREVPGNVTITGYIEDDFEAHFDLADIALNPMTTGGGTNIKLIDYTARGLPVVSSPFGIRGLKTEFGSAVAVADIDAFPDSISNLASNPQQRQRIGERSRRITSNKYTWEKASISLRSQLVKHIDIDRTS